MKTRFAGVCQILALTLVISSLSAFVVAADTADTSENVTARYVVIPPKPAAPGTRVPARPRCSTWNGSFTHNGTNFNYVMVGTDPATGQGYADHHLHHPGEDHPFDRRDV